LPEALRPFWKPRYDRVLLNEQFTIEDAIPTENGTIYIQVTFNPIVKKGKVVGGSCFGSNITARKVAELELIKAKEHAEESDRLKSAFLQNMSHEIRTPMNAIMGFSDLLVENHGNKENLEKFSQIISHSCSDLLEIINDILDISKIESGQLVVHNEDFDINHLFSELNSFFTEQQIRLGKHHLNLRFKFDGDQFHSMVKTDKVKLKQILINLIGNAFKFTTHGSIEYGCRPQNDSLLFYVSDTGIGIPHDKQEKVFERFTQLHNPSLKNTGGTGLGLSIARGLVNLLGGKIWLVSEVEDHLNGKQGGTTFYFTIRYNHPDNMPMTVKVKGDETPLTFTDKALLIVDDDSYNAMYLKEILANSGFIVQTAEYGEDAVRIASNQPLDLILMDVRLPGIDGYETTRQIRQNNPNMKIIAQTAYAAYDERKKALEAGCVDYISKPIRRELMLSLISKHLKG
jgi:signal transduction histidine kinase